MFFGQGGFPFGDFEEMGGRGGRGGPPKEIDNTKFYKVLGVDKQADFKEIKKAYFKLARTHHPDRGGDTEKFQEIQAAYEVLSDKEKRELYDRHGEEGVNQGGRGCGGGGMNDIFSQMFGGGGPGGHGGPSGPKKGKPVTHPMKCTLEEIFNGKNTKIAVNRERICQACDGKGGPEGAVQKCGTCRGRGIVNKMVQLGPGMYSQSQGPCDDCRGKGEIVDEAKRCQECKGKKVKKEKKILEASIDKGSPNNCQYTFHGEADEFPGQEAGDVVIIVQEQPHKVFKRKGADLLFEQKITLVEALTGVNFVIKHLDGTNIRIKSTPGEVIKPDDLKTIPDKGLPFHKQSFKFGNLFVMFKVTFPDSVKVAKVPSLLQALPGPAQSADTDMAGDAETIMLQNFSESQRNTKAAGGTQDDSDEEGEQRQRGPGGPGGVQCAQQ